MAENQTPKKTLKFYGRDTKTGISFELVFGFNAAGVVKLLYAEQTTEPESRKPQAGGHLATGED